MSHTELEARRWQAAIDAAYGRNDLQITIMRRRDDTYIELDEPTVTEESIELGRDARAGERVAMSRIYRRTIEGWRLEGNDAWVMPAADQSDAWDALTTAEQDRIVDKWDVAIFDEVMHDDLTVLPGERAYEQWKADRQEAMR